MKQRHLLNHMCIPARPSIYIYIYRGKEGTIEQNLETFSQAYERHFIQKSGMMLKGHSI